jgi:hypothetical protein
MVIDRDSIFLRVRSGGLPVEFYKHARLTGAQNLILEFGRVNPAIRPAAFHLLC